MTKFLHIHCGDTSAKLLRDSSIPGNVLVWREIYVEGPVPGNLSIDEFCRVRADFLSNQPGLNISRDSILEGSITRYHTLAEAEKYDEVILWFDACMFDQTILIHLIDQCAKQAWPNTRLSLICEDCDLSSLTPHQLTEMLNNRHEITSEQISLAHNAWIAFTDSSPHTIEELLQKDCSALPFLSDALQRHLEQFPCQHNGLNRTQNQLLRTIANGTTKLIDIFVRTQGMEPRPFMGDTSLWTCIDDLANVPTPLLQLNAGNIMHTLTVDPENCTPSSSKQLNQWNVTITAAGREVLSGTQDHIQLNGIHRWVGGAHLQSPNSIWRWDEKNSKLISPPEDQH